MKRSLYNIGIFPLPCLEIDRALPPFFTKTLRNVDSVIGGTCHLDCKVSGSLPIKVSWFKHDKEISPSAKYTIRYEEGSASLEIKNLDTKDVGVYSCKATNSAGSKECSSALAVKGVPSFLPSFLGVSFQKVFVNHYLLTFFQICLSNIV